MRISPSYSPEVSWRFWSGKERPGSCLTTDEPPLPVKEANGGVRLSHGTVPRSGAQGSRGCSASGWSRAPLPLRLLTDEKPLLRLYVLSARSYLPGGHRIFQYFLCFQAVVSKHQVTAEQDSNFVFDIMQTSFRDEAVSGEDPCKHTQTPPKPWKYLKQRLIRASSSEYCRGWRFPLKHGAVSKRTV